jgi:signal transduction histidine kinase
MGGVDTIDLPPAAACSAALVAAVARLAERLDSLPATWMASRDEILAALQQIAVDVERSCAVPKDVQEPIKATNPVLHHRLVDALRAELLAEWRAGSDADEVATSHALVTLMWALESYRARLWPANRNDLAARLADPDALELVVEVAHDLRSPLNSILFLAEVLRSGQSGPITPHQRGQLGLIYGATMGMISVVNDVMELSRDPEGTGEEEPSRFSIGRVFDSVHEVVRPIAEEKKIALEFGLPDYDHCLGRPLAIGRVILNLTINALKFTEVGRVSVSAKRIDRAHVTFSVLDTGRGISPAVQAHLFQPFQRAASRDRHFFAKAGLGLSIARRLVQSMGAELTYETEAGKGTVFSFTLDLPSV